MGKGKRVAAAPTIAKKGASAAPSKAETFHESHSHLFLKNTRKFGIGRNLPHRRDLTRYVKWPRYIRIQRQRAILNKRLKVPPAINQFSRTLDKNQGSLSLTPHSHSPSHPSHSTSTQSLCTWMRSAYRNRWKQLVWTASGDERSNSACCVCVSVCLCGCV